MKNVLNQFRDYLLEMKQYQHVSALLQWDLQTQTPENGQERLMELSDRTAARLFQYATAEEYGRMLEELSEPQQFERLDPAMQLTVRRLLREHRRLLRVPADFYNEYASARTRSGRAWEKAKRSDDFSLFAPHLDKVITLTKQYVNYMEPDADPYEVLLGLYEEGIDSETINCLFDEIKDGLRPLLAGIAAAPAPDLSALEGHYDIDAQKKVQRLLLDYIGFDFASGAVGESEHPFTTRIRFGDVRLTNHYLEDNPISAMFSAIHEGGHAIFEQGIPAELENTAAEQVDLMGLHESQSRFYENILGRKKQFWIPIYDKLGELLPQLKQVPLDTFYRAVNLVRPSMIRTEADEVTYCLHIILRYEIEQAIFRGNVSAKDLPGLWNDKMEELLGIRPQTNAEGILQDMHWSDGSFGYFPSYLLGSVYDGMFLEQLTQELGDPDQILAEGRIQEITGWLNRKIHRYGSLYNSAQVIERVCGREISAKPLLDYFRKKYSEIYQL